MDETLDELAAEFNENRRLFEESQKKLRLRFEDLQIRKDWVLFEWKRLGEHSLEEEIEFRRVVDESNSIVFDLARIETRRNDLYQELLKAGKKAKKSDFEKTIAVSRGLRDASVYDLSEGLAARTAAMDVFQQSILILESLLNKPSS